MILGIPKEIKNYEYRVSMTPSGVAEAVKHGHKVYVQQAAGEGSGFPDEAYRKAGAEILNSPEEVYAKAEMVVKVKEPQEKEYSLIRKDQIVFTFFHFASSEIMTKAMVKSGAICIAYETIEKADKSLPILIPMSEVAGRLSVQQGAKYLEKQYQGKGVLLGGVPGVRPANVLILGAGTVGTEAARMAAGLGANVCIMDINLQRLRYLSDVLPANVNTLLSHTDNIREKIGSADLIIGSVLIPGGKAPRLITREMLKEMQAGTVLVDVAVDQGGCIETARPTTHDNPVYVIDGIVHYCVTNMPGAVPFTSTAALTNVTLPYILQVADKGWKEASELHPELKAGLNIVQGKIVHKKVGEAFGD